MKEYSHITEEVLKTVNKACDYVTANELQVINDYLAIGLSLQLGMLRVRSLRGIQSEEYKALIFLMVLEDKNFDTWFHEWLDETNLNKKGDTHA